MNPTMNPERKYINRFTMGFLFSSIVESDEEVSNEVPPIVKICIASSICHYLRWQDGSPSRI